MATTLYRKYRPQKFSELTSQNHVKVTLGNEVARGEVAHAFLFSGPRGVGKTTTARILAKAVNCLKRTAGSGEPCNACHACESITAGRALDVIEIDAASHTGVDNVREQIIEHTRFAPSEFARKVFIIDEAHMLSGSAWNALLKTLEEPPPHVIFVLATTELHKVPETVISRCQRFDFLKINLADLVARLAHLAAEENVTVDRAVLERVARAAEGSVRDAESLFGQVLALGETHIHEAAALLVLPHSDIALGREFLEAAARADAAAAVMIVGRLVDQGVDLPQFVSDCIALGRALLHHHLSIGLDAALGLDEENRSFLDRLRELVPLSAVAPLLEELVRARAAIKEPDAGALPLEICAVRLAALAAGNESMNRPMIARVKPQESSESVPAATLTIETLAGRWAEIVSAVNEGNRSLPIVLHGAKPIRIEDSSVTVGVSHRFHVAKLLEEKNRRLIESALSKVCGAPLRFHAEFVPGAVPAASDDDPAVRAALQAFGGRLVE